MIAAFIQLGLNVIVGAAFFLLGRWTAPQPPEPHRSVSEMVDRIRRAEGQIDLRPKADVVPIRGGGQ